MKTLRLLMLAVILTSWAHTAQAHHDTAFDEECIMSVKEPDQFIRRCGTDWHYHGMLDSATPDEKRGEHFCFLAQKMDPTYAQQISKSDSSDERRYWQEFRAGFQILFDHYCKDWDGTESVTAKQLRGKNKTSKIETEAVSDIGDEYNGDELFKFEKCKASIWDGIATFYPCAASCNALLGKAGPKRGLVGSIEENCSKEKIAQSSNPTVAVEQCEAMKELFEQHCSVQEAHSTQQDAPDDRTAQSQNVEMQREVRKLVQRGLASLGFDPGPADGLFGPKTRAAIRGWRAANALDATGHLTMPEAEALAAVGAETSETQEEAHSTGCSVANHESALLDLTDTLFDLTDATAAAEEAYAQLIRNADPGREHTSVVVDDLERLIDNLFAVRSKLDRNNLEHLRDQEKAEREVMGLCIDDHYRAKRVASSCADELREYRRAIRSLTILAEDLIVLIGNAESAGGDITINASTTWPTSAARTKVRNEDLDRMNRLIREAKDIGRQLEGDIRAERHPRKDAYNCVRQMPTYY